jgi:hypothetical protein
VDLGVVALDLELARGDQAEVLAVQDAAGVVAEPGQCGHLRRGVGYGGRVVNWAPVGELALTRGPVTCGEGHEMHVEWIRVDHADPVILITCGLLRELLLWGCGPHAELKPGPGATAIRQVEDQLQRLEGWLLTVRGENRTVMYRIAEKSASAYGYVAEWPD